MNNQPQPVCYDEDEIDLRELFKTIARYKIFIITFTLFITLVAAIYAFAKKPIYEIKADIQVGYVSNSNSNSNSNSKIYLINPNALKLFIMNNFDNSSNPKKSLPKVTANLVKRTKDILNVSVDDISNESAKEYLQMILQAIKKQEETKLQSYLQNVSSQIKILTEQKEKIEKQLPTLYKELKKVKEPFIYQTLLTNIKQMNDDVLDIKLKINQLQAEISPLNITRTSVIGHIKQHDYPIKPKKKLIIVVAFITGLILSIFLVFFIEFIKSMKEEDDAQQAKE